MRTLSFVSAGSAGSAVSSVRASAQTAPSADGNNDDVGANDNGIVFAMSSCCFSQVVVSNDNNEVFVFDASS